jgi:hypothetical protein
MKFIDYVNKDVKYRVHNFDLVSDGLVLNWLYYTNNKLKQLWYLNIEIKITTYSVK